MTGTIPTNFRMLQSVFDDRMNRFERATAARDAGYAETEVVKTYLLELTEHDLPEKSLRSTLRDIFSTSPAASVKKLNVAFAEHDKLLNITSRYRGRRISAYVDFKDARFLRLHSTTKSDLLDDLVLGWTAKLPEIDHAWFDDEFLYWCSQLGSFRGIGVEFNNQPLTTGSDLDLEADDASESIRLRQSGKAQKMLELLRSSDDFAQQSSLAMVRIRRQSSNVQLTSEIRYDGRISGRGDSFVRHSEMIEKIVERYSHRVLDVERRFSMFSRRVGAGYALTGGPIRIELKPKVDNLHAFCQRLFGAINPFRLSGLPRNVGTDHFVVAAVDLHTAQTLRFELTPECIWVFLPAGACGNTLLRFITNLQRHHSRLVSAPQLNWEATGAL